MNIVFMGTPDFAVESLKRIYESGHNIKAVISQPDKKAGRGMNIMPTFEKKEEKVFYRLRWSFKRREFHRRC